jgi:hypothetical protein
LSKKERLKFYIPPENEMHRTLDLLRAYKYQGPRISGGKWIVEFCVAYEDGSIERWHIAGETQPFEVEKYDKVTVKQKGAILPLP